MFSTRLEFRKGDAWVILSLSRRLWWHTPEKSVYHSLCLLPIPFQGPLKSKAATSFNRRALEAWQWGWAPLVARTDCSRLGTRPQCTMFGPNLHFEIDFPCLQWSLPHHTMSGFCCRLKKSCHFLCWSCWQPRGGIGITGQWWPVPWMIALSTAWKSCHVWYDRVWLLGERFLWDLDEIWAILPYPQNNLSKLQL